MKSYWAHPGRQARSFKQGHNPFRYPLQLVVRPDPGLRKLRAQPHCARFPRLRRRSHRSSALTNWISWRREATSRLRNTRPRSRRLSTTCEPMCGCLTLWVTDGHPQSRTTPGYRAQPGCHHRYWRPLSARTALSVHMPG